MNKISVNRAVLEGKWRGKVENVRCNFELLQ